MSNKESLNNSGSNPSCDDVKRDSHGGSSQEKAAGKEGRSSASGSSILLFCITNLCRLLLSITFVFSGFVKAVDPVGTQYKIEDYAEAMGLPGILPEWITLTASVLMSALEFSLGVFLLFAIMRRAVSKTNSTDR